MPDFHTLPLWANLGLFVAGAVLVWFAGTRLSRYADVVAERTGLGDAFIGALLLGGITSLPEIATSISATMAGNAALAVNNVFGGIAMQIAILAGVDPIARQGALSSLSASATVLTQGALLIIVLAVAGAGLAVGGGTVLGVSLWALAVLLAAAAGLYLAHAPGTREEHDGGQAAAEGPNPGVGEEAGGRGPAELRHHRGAVRQWSTRRVVVAVVLAALAILVAGFVVARSADALSEQTALGASFIGVFFAAIATSLPEVSSTVEAMRLQNYRLAFSNIFGTNLFDAALLLPIDIVYRKGPVFEAVDASAALAAALGIVLASIYLVGLSRRSRSTIGGMGYDSAAVAIVYLGGVSLLYAIR